MSTISTAHAPTAQSRAIAQRAELHISLPDAELTALAGRAVYPRRSVWRRIANRLGA